MNTTEIIMWIAIVVLCFCVLSLLCAIGKLRRRVESLENDVESLQWSVKRDYDRIVSLFCFIKERCQSEVGTAVADFDELERAFMGEFICDIDNDLTDK